METDVDRLRTPLRYSTSSFAALEARPPGLARAAPAHPLWLLLAKLDGLAKPVVPGPVPVESEVSNSVVPLGESGVRDGVVGAGVAGICAR